MLRIHGCRICGGTPNSQRSSSFKLCQEDTDKVFEYVGAPMMTNGTPWLGEDLANRASLMRARYAAAVRLLGWPVEAKAPVTPTLPQREVLL